MLNKRDDEIQRLREQVKLQERDIKHLRNLLELRHRRDTPSANWYTLGV